MTTPLPHQTPWTPRPGDELLSDQLQAIDRWHASRHAVEESLAARARSREGLLDVRRRMDALRLEQAALLRRAEDQLREGQAILRGMTGPRAVIAHRNAWFRGKVAQALWERGVHVLASVEDGAEATAAMVLEQPDLLVVEDLLPGVSGIQLLTRARTLAPRTVVGAQAASTQGLSALLEAGATAVFARQVPPADVADQLMDCLRPSS